MANHAKYNAHYINIEVSGKDVTKIIKTNSLRRRWTNTLCATLRLNRNYLTVYNVLKISNGVILRVEYLLNISNEIDRNISVQNEYIQMNGNKFHDAIGGALKKCVCDNSLARDIQFAFNFDELPFIKLLTSDENDCFVELHRENEENMVYSETKEDIDAVVRYETIDETYIK